jgi:hypothetical protein
MITAGVGLRGAAIIEAVSIAHGCRTQRPNQRQNNVGLRITKMNDRAEALQLRRRNDLSARDLRTFESKGEFLIDYRSRGRPILAVVFTENAAALAGLSQGAPPRL